MHERESYASLIGRLNRQSVVKHFDAYQDVDWDAPENRIDPADPRWELGADDPLGATRWYRAQDPERRAWIGLTLRMQQAKTGIAFEAILGRGLLEFAASLPNGTPEFRYALHEVAEECQHSMMFQELINRSRVDVRALGPVEERLSQRVPRLGRTFPELFFLHVLAGEAPIDHLQRGELRRRDDAHPLVRRIMRIHVTEEARHICFARRFLEETVPYLNAPRRWSLRIHAPFVLRTTADQMVRPPRRVARTLGIPAAVLREAYVESPIHRQRVLEGTAPVRATCRDLGLVVPSTLALWKGLGLWPHDEPLRIPAGADPAIEPQLRSLAVVA